MRLSFGLLFLVGTAAFAQNAPLTIEQRLEKLERENAELKRQLKAKPTPPATIPAPPKDKLAPGWTVLIYPRLLKDQQPFPVGAFVAKAGGFRFGDLRSQTSHSGWASFKGEGKFFAYAEGPYSFSIEVRGTERLSFFVNLTCDVALRINDSDLIPASQARLQLETQGVFNHTWSGGSALPTGAHPIEFQVGCQFRDGYINATADDMFLKFPQSKAMFDDIRVAINVFGPTDRTARPLRDEELGHDRKHTTTAR